MTTAIQDLIRENAQRPVRKCYIKRKSIAGVYETDWYRVDIIDGVSQVKTWGSVSLEIDAEQGRIGKFSLGNLTMAFRNDTGAFNNENDARSLWYGYLNRKYTKLKIECGYLDEDNTTEVGMAVVFEGVIDYVKTSDDQTASVRVLPYTSILKAYDISDLSLTGKKSINTIVNAIMNQTKITDFIPYVASAAQENVDITDTSLITGNYWKVLTDLALKSASIPLLNASAWTFTGRTASVSSVFDFEGRGYAANSDIIAISSYDDGDTKTVIRWLVTGTNLEAITTDPVLLLKYLGNTETLTLDDVDTTPQKQGIIDELLALWQYPKQVIEFKTRFFINQIKPTDRVTIRIKGQYTPENTLIWGGNAWGDGSVWGTRIGSIILDSQTPFMVTKISKNISDWVTQITAEEIL